MTVRNSAVGRLALVTVAAVTLVAAPARAQSRPPIVFRAEQCLRQNVDRVVAAERDLQSAAAFLVTYACAGEVAGAQKYYRNSAYIQMFNTVIKTVATATPPGTPAKPAAPNPLAGLDLKASVDPETGEFVTAPTAPGAPANPLAAMLPMMSGLFGQVAPDSTPVELRKLAGELVLAARAKAR